VFFPDVHREILFSSALFILEIIEHVSTKLGIGVYTKVAGRKYLIMVLIAQVQFTIEHTLIAQTIKYGSK